MYCQQWTEGWCVRDKFACRWCRSVGKLVFSPSPPVRPFPYGTVKAGTWVGRADERWEGRTESCLFTGLSYCVFSFEHGEIQVTGKLLYCFIRLLAILWIYLKEGGEKKEKRKKKKKNGSRKTGSGNKVCNILLFWSTSNFLVFISVFSSRRLPCFYFHARIYSRFMNYRNVCE